MTRTFVDQAGKYGPEFNPRALMQTIERHLAQKTSIANKNVEAAQQLVYDAWEAESDVAEKALIFGALKLDPLNVDALVRVGEYAGLEGEPTIAYLRQVVAAGEKGLGPKAFKDFAGQFWGFIETRPYMRARERLAEALRHVGRLDEAVAEWNAMLDLNPADNQGIRYQLLPALLALNRLEPTRKLFDQYPGEADFNTVFAWGRVLERFLSDDLKGATAALASARKQNPHTQSYVKGHRRLPKHLPPSYSPGSHEETICFAETLHTAWKKHPAALLWLETQKVK